MLVMEEREDQKARKVSDIKYISGAIKRKVEKKSPNKLALAAIFLLICVLVIAGVTFFRTISSKLSVFSDRQAVQPEAGADGINGFNLDAAKGKLGEVLDTLKQIFTGAGKSVAGAGNLAGEISGLSEDVRFLEANIVSLVLQKKGEDVISRLESISGHLKKMQEEESNFDVAVNALGSFASSSMNSYLSLKLDLLKSQKLVDSALLWLNSDSPHHILVMFQNPSEIRPAGGFLGSYADVFIQKGNIESFDIRDISDPDKVLETKTIPPKPLQALVKNWRAADSNWFFDFPQSAATVLKFVESSPLYADKQFFFDGAIAVSPKVIEDVLKITGPITVGGKTFTGDNFLLEIQKAVQAGQAKNISVSSGAQPTYPKGILKELGTAILEKLASMSGSVGNSFSGMAADWIDKKDTMMYFKDADLENFAVEYGTSGSVYEFSRNFMGDYIALVEANIGGGKSDMFVKRDVALESQINADGTVGDRVTITLDHQGNTSADWWYKIPDQVYVQLFVPPSSRLTNFTGGIAKEIASPIDYAKNGYAENPLVAEIKSSTENVFAYPVVSVHPELGKKVFSTWIRVKPGESKQLVFGYTHRLFLPPADGRTYDFIFEKQAGTERTYTFNLSAPPGFVFEENNLPTFEYESNDPSGRVLIQLTMKKIQ